MYGVTRVVVYIVLYIEIMAKLATAASAAASDATCNSRAVLSTKFDKINKIRVTKEMLIKLAWPSSSS